METFEWAVRIFSQSELVDFGLDSYIDLRFFKIECLTSILYLWIEFSGVVSRVEVKRKVAIRGKVRRRNGSVRKYV